MHRLLTDVTVDVAPHVVTTCEHTFCSAEEKSLEHVQSFIDEPESETPAAYQ